MSFLAIVAVAATAGGATYAYFSDVAKSTNNTYASGKMELSLTDTDETQKANVTKSFGETDLFPGDDIELQEMTVENTGGVDGHHLNLTFTLNKEDTTLAKHIVLEDDGNGLRFGPSAEGAESIDLFGVLTGDTDDDYTAEKPDGSSLGTLPTPVSLQDLHDLGTIRIIPADKNEGIKAGTQAKLWIDAMVDTDLEKQGESVAMTVEFEIQQDASQQ